MRRIVAPLLICLLLTGCWDQVQLKNLLFVDVIGIDYEKENKNRLQVHYVISSLREANQGGGKPFSLYEETTGDNLYDAVAQTNKERPGVLSVLETRLFLISSEFAKGEPLRHLDIASQFVSNPMYAHLAVYDGDLSKLLARPRMKEQTVSNFLVGLLDDEIRRGRIPSNKLLHYILGGNQFVNDFALNRFEPYKDEVRLAGTALFSNGRYTGMNLNNEQTQLASLLHGESGNIQLLTGNRNSSPYTILVQNASRRIIVGMNGDKLGDIEISLRLNVKLIEDGISFRRHNDNMIKEAEARIASDLLAKSTEVLAALQRANCDFLQLGHEVAAYHPDVFKGLDWRKQYPKVVIKPNVKVRILNTAILE